MRSRIGLVLTGLVVALTVLTAPMAARSSSAQSTPNDVFASDRVIVKFAPDVGPFFAAQIAAEHGTAVGSEIAPLGVRVLQVPVGRVLDTVAALAKNPHVVYVEPAYLVEGTYDPNDAYYTSRQYGPQKIQANLAWDVTKGSSDVIVAVVDSGTDPNHPDLAGKLVSGYDFVNNDADPSDDNGHGTHVAGIVGAATDNGVGVAGIGFQTRVMPVKVLNANNSGYWDWVANGIVYAVDQGAKVINLSLGGTTGSRVVQDAVNYAWGRGALVVAAAGNNGSSTPFYPAAYDKAMGVAATTSTDERWSLSNYGSFVSVSAPGASVYSTYWEGGSSTYRYKSGTSMAAPHVSGVAALLLAQDPGRSNATLRSIIESTADDLGSTGWDQYFGYGRVNAYRAVTFTGTSVGDHVWYDLDGDGQQDAGEPGLANVTLNLTGEATPPSQATDASGGYDFTGLQAGQYQVDVDENTLPGVVTLTTVNEPLDVTLTAGQDYNDADFGYRGACGIRGTVFQDDNPENGQRDPGESGLANVTVNLYWDVDGDGQIDPEDTLLAATMTASDGTYGFDNLLAGAYVVEEIDPPMYTSTTSNQLVVSLACADVGGASENNDFGDTPAAPTAVRLASFTARTAQSRWSLVPPQSGVRVSPPVLLTGVTLIGVGGLRMRRRKA